MRDSPISLPEQPVTSPYDIEEIFPDDAAAAVRLPRRQSGSSPQGLAVTLLADYTLRHRAWLPSAAIVALLAESGVSQAGARTAISRLARRGILEATRHGRHSSYRLTAPAAGFLAAGGSWVVSPTAGTPPWDEHWTLVAFSLPQEHGTQRRGLRSQLRWLGFAPLYDGLWISPHGPTEKARTQLAQLTLGAMTMFRARHIDLAGATRRDPIDAWDVPAIAKHYESFIQQWSPLLPRIGAARIGGPEAVRTRTEIMDTYRRFRVLDPQLPGRLLPADWQREAAGDLFTAVYDGLVEVAQKHVRSVVADLTGDVHPEVRAHTVAELLAGIPAADRADLTGRPAPGR